MELDFNVTGEDRKKLVSAIADISGFQKEYLGAPTFAFKVGEYVIDRYGTVRFETDVYNIKQQLNKLGYFEECSEESSENCAVEIDGFSIGIPDKGFTAINNLNAIIKSKEQLFKKAIGTNKDLSVDITDEGVFFDWFETAPSQNDTDIYAIFFKSLMTMAENAKRVTAKQKTIDNEKYTMRTFLIRLGLNGEKYKELRKLLTKNLSGNSAFR